MNRDVLMQPGENGDCSAYLYSVIIHHRLIFVKRSRMIFPSNFPAADPLRVYKLLKIEGSGSISGLLLAIPGAL